MEIIGSFVSILSRLIAKNGTKERFYLSILFTIKKLFKKYFRLNKMLDDENCGFGLDAFDEES